jgi:hypothetical protein
MAGDEKLVLNHALCFLFSRLHKSEVRHLKTVMLNFYSSEDIGFAKEVLINCAKTVQNADNAARIPRRREGENRAVRELDDIFNIIADLDVTKMLGDLPKFVSDSPDKMPSVNLVEGDLNAVMRRFDKLDNQLNHLEISVNKSVATAAITQDVHASAGRGAINNSVVMNERTAAVAVAASLTNVNNNANINVNKQGVSATASTSHWAASYISSVESGSGAEVSDVDDGHWREVKRRKRRRTPSNPQNSASSVPSRAIPANNYATAASKPPVKQQSKRQHKQFPTVVGRSREPIISDVGCVGQITAAKPYIGKATFCVDNVSLTGTAESMARYVAAMDIDVLGCYEVNPRRTIWQRQQGIYPNDRKTFRVCIPKEDSKRFLDPLRWPAHIAVSQWRFKKRQDDDREQAVSDPASHAAGRTAPSNSAPSGALSSNAPPSLAPCGTRPGTPSMQSAAASAAGSASSGAVAQSTPYRLAVLPLDAESVDMDATILVSSHGDAVE